MLSKWIFVGIVLMVIGQRLFELQIAKNNEVYLLSQGGKKHNDNLIGAVKILQTLWLISAIAEVYLFNRPFILPLALVALAITLTGQILRYLSMQALKKRWTLSIMTLKNAPVVDQGIYRYLVHPNWLGVILEIAALPLIHSAYLTAIIFSLANGIIMNKRIETEESALATASNYSAFFDNRPRFIPRISR